MSDNMPEPQMPPVKLAFVIDDEVVDVLHTDERLGAIFLSDPLIIDVSNLVDDDGNLRLPLKSKYNATTQTFTDPE
jgi:hypothetical protein